jgi:hypothetical protein
LIHYSGGFKGGLWGLQPPRRINQAHILTYAFQGLVNVTIWLLIEWFRSVKVKENRNKFLCIELIFKEVIISNYAKSNFQVYLKFL